MRYPKNFPRKNYKLLFADKPSLVPMKTRMQKRHEQHYAQLSSTEIRPTYHELNMYGNDIRICGSTPLDLSSTHVVLTCLEDYKPESVILGERERFDLEYMRKGNPIYESSSKLYGYKENLFAKKDFTRFFTKEMPENIRYFKTHSDFVVYEADTSTKKVYSDDYASAAYYACNSFEVGLMFGKPERTLFIEDLALRFTLDELKSAFYQVLDTTAKRHDIENPYPFNDTDHIMRTIREITKEMHSHTLYKKDLMYQASVLKKSVRNYKRSFLVTNEMWTQHIEDFIQEPGIPEYDHIFRTYLNKDTKHELPEDKRFAWKKDFDSDRVRELANQALSKFDFASEKNLYENIKHMNPKEILEKYAILNQLIDPRDRYFLNNGINPFSPSIFNPLFESLSPEDLQMKFNDANSEYSLALHKYQNHEIKRLASYSDKAGRSGVVKYSQTMNDLENRKNVFGYRFMINLIEKMKETMIISRLLMGQILTNIEHRIASGDGENQTILHLKRYMEGSYNAEDIEIFQRLLIEANTELKLLKLPSHYSKYTGYIKALKINLIEEANKMKLDNIISQLAKPSPLDQIEVFGDSLYIKSNQLTEQQKKIENKEDLIFSLIEKTADESISLEENAKKITEELMKKYKGITPELLEKNQSGKMFSFVLGAEEQTIPEDIQKLGFQEIIDKGGQVITEFDINQYHDGSMDVGDLNDESKSKFKEVLDMLSKQQKPIDNFSDDDK